MLQVVKLESKIKNPDVRGTIQKAFGELHKQVKHKINELTMQAMQENGIPYKMGMSNMEFYMLQQEHNIRVETHDKFRYMYSRNKLILVMSDTESKQEDGKLVLSFKYQIFKSAQVDNQLVHAN